MDSAVCRPGETRIGWIGTGVMGRSMCGHLIAAGYDVTVYNRTREKTDSLLEQGAQWAETPEEVAKQSDVVFTIVGFPADVREVILGPAGVLAGFGKAASGTSKVVVDMTTSDPSLAVEIAETSNEHSIGSIDAPVSGGDVGAQSAKLSIMIGGEKPHVDFVMPCFEVMGATLVHQGGPGAGQHTKMVNQTLVAAGMVGVCEALLYGYRAGLDLSKVLQSVSSGAAGSWALSNLGPRIMDNDFDPGFFVEHFVKDMGIVLAEANRMNLFMPGLALANQLYQALKSQGHAKDGTQALQLALAKCSGFDWKNRS